MKNLILLGMFCAYGAMAACDGNNLLPMFGDPKHKVNSCDKKFIDESLKTKKPRNEIARDIARTGWGKIQEGDPDTAIKRFNQAWLLNPKCPEAIWGFGVVMDIRGNPIEAEKYLAMAREIEKKEPGLYVDSARIALHAQKFDQAKTFVYDALRLDEKFPPALALEKEIQNMGK